MGRARRRFDRSRPRPASPVYSSSVMWKFVPPKPNELTAARRGVLPSLIHGLAWVFR